jgi:S-adenosylmethionine hydrolase
VSATFHGRDVFAPAAAHLAGGLDLAVLGPLLADPVRLRWPSCRVEEGTVVGEVTGRDRFGNVLTSITARALDALGAGAVEVEIGGRTLAGLLSSYDASPPGGLGAIVGSGGRLEVFLREGNAAALLGIERGARVRVRVADSRLAR